MALKLCEFLEKFIMEIFLIKNLNNLRNLDQTRKNFTLLGNLIIKFHSK